MVPVDSVRVSRARTYSGTFREAALMSRTGLSPSMAGLSSTILLRGRFVTPMWKALQPRKGKPSRFRLFRFRSPLLTESRFLSFPLGTEMFQFPRLAARCLWIQHRLVLGIPGSQLVCQLPRAFRRLPRPSSPSNAETSPMCPW